jgi:hypothetical protein
MSTIGSERIYRVSGINPYFMFATLLLFTAFVPVVLVKFVQTGEWFYLAWAAVVMWFWFNALFRIAYRIELDGDAVMFKTLALRKQTRLSRIRSIRSGNAGYTTVRFDDGRVDLVGAFDGFHDFVTRVKQANPAVELKGV